MARARGFARSTGRRADLRWTGGRQSFQALNGGTSAQGVIVTAGITSQTLMRIRGELLLIVTGAETSGDSADIGVGLLLQQAGATATSLPLADDEAPFIWYARHVLTTRAAAVSDALGARVVRTVIDNKAMRVIRPDQELVVIANNLTIAGALQVDVHVSMRFLLAD